MELEALVRTTHSYFEKLAQESKRVSQETLHSVLAVDDPEQLADIIAANVLTSLEDRQSILEKLKVSERLEAVCSILLRETELSDVEKQVQSRIKQLEKIDLPNKDVDFLRHYMLTMYANPAINHLKAIEA